MKSLKTSTQYRKDLKRYRNKPQKLEALPQEYYPHMLQGEYKGCMECHIQGDFLLIWIDEVNDIIELVRLGSHSELFR